MQGTKSRHEKQESALMYPTFEQNPPSFKWDFPQELNAEKKAPFGITVGGPWFPTEV
jgi:hypothetical protein